MAGSVKRSISFDPDVLRDAEHLAAEASGGNLSAFVGDAVAQHVKVIRGRQLMREDRDRFGPVEPDVLEGVDAEWPA